MSIFLILNLTLARFRGTSNPDPAWEDRFPRFPAQFSRDCEPGYKAYVHHTVDKKNDLNHFENYQISRVLG